MYATPILAGTGAGHARDVIAACRRKNHMTGEIKRLERSRGFGFIRPEGASEDVFFHSSALQGLVFDSLNEGQAVEFEKQPDDRDPRRCRAVNVRVSA
jgi:CspA family cold shock protein